MHEVSENSSLQDNVSKKDSVFVKVSCKACIMFMSREEAGSGCKINYVGVCVLRYGGWDISRA